MYVYAFKTYTRARARTIRIATNTKPCHHRISSQPPACHSVGGGDGLGGAAPVILIVNGSAGRPRSLNKEATGKSNGK